MKECEQIGTLTESLEKAEKRVGKLKKERNAAIGKSGDLRKGKERAGNERDGLHLS